MIPFLCFFCLLVILSSIGGPYPRIIDETIRLSSGSQCSRAMSVSPMHHWCHLPPLISGQVTITLIITSSGGWSGPSPWSEADPGVTGGRSWWPGGRCSHSPPGCCPPHTSRNQSHSASPETRVSVRGARQHQGFRGLRNYPGHKNCCVIRIKPWLT